MVISLSLSLSLFFFFLTFRKNERKIAKVNLLYKLVRELSHTIHKRKLSATSKLFWIFIDLPMATMVEFTCVIRMIYGIDLLCVLFELN